MVSYWCGLILLSLFRAESNQKLIILGLRINQELIILSLWIDNSILVTLIYVWILT